MKDMATVSQAIKYIIHMKSVIHTQWLCIQALLSIESMDTCRAAYLNEQPHYQIDNVGFFPP